ncbi:hypothetical protein KEM56_006235, partial [Ascosphaera pollenicola]
MDIYTVLPDLDVSQFSTVLRAAENARITVKDLLISDVLEIAKRTRLPVIDVRRCVNHIVKALHRDLGFAEVNQDGGEELLGEIEPMTKRSSRVRPHPCPEVSFISTLDPILDETLGGGIATRYLTEIAGERQVHLRDRGDRGERVFPESTMKLTETSIVQVNAIYLSTESELPTERLVQLLNSNCVYFDAVDETERPCLDNIHSVTAVDLETQNHILEFQVPLMVERGNIGLVVVDSIAANYRGELSSQDPHTLVERAWQLKHLGHLLQTLAAKKDVAVVVSNQVYDHWTDLHDFGDYPAGNASSTAPIDQAERILNIQRDEVSGNSSPVTPARTGHDLISSPLSLTKNQRLTPSSTPAIPQTPDNRTENNGARHASHACLEVPPLQHVLSLDYQQPFFTGFGKPGMANWKTPALGVVWTNQVACRIVLTKEDYEVRPPPLSPKIKSLSTDASAKLAAVNDAQTGSILSNERHISDNPPHEEDSHIKSEVLQENAAKSA